MIFGIMDLPSDVEAILSDDYEEGEILEDDSLYEDVSSLEEFSFQEPEPLVVDLTEDPPTHVAKSQRKKEHKCKEGSICRRERKGKHCFARIRKEKPSIPPKPKEVKELPKEPEKFISDKNSARRLEPPPRRNSERYRHPSPTGRARSDRARLRYDRKDHQEKENRIANRRHWNSNEKNFRSRVRSPEKYSSYSRSSKDYKSKTSSSALGAYRKPYDEDHGSDSSKTSLLKRLVGSGNSGLKNLNEGESHNFVGQPSEPVSSESVVPSNPIDDLNSEAGCQVASVDEPKPTKENQTVEISTTEEAPPVKTEVKKTFGMVWKRNMKEDKDELTLRVEALKSAWVRKFSERKRMGLINKKSGADDSLADFVFGSDDDSEEEVKNDAKNTNKVPGNNISSGDILHPEDQALDPATDDIDGTPIVNEPALVLATPALDESSVFIPSELLGLPDLPIDGNVPQVVPVNSNMPLTSTNDQSVIPSYSPPVAIENIPFNNQVPSSKKKKRSGRKSNKRTKKKSTSQEMDEEIILRENALKSLKMKPKCGVNTVIKPLNGLPSVSLPYVASKKIAGIFETDMTGVTSSDNLDEDIDEDILRAQLLSSLTKKMSDIGVESVTKVPSIKKVLPKKQKRLKNISKNVWKNNITPSEIKLLKNELKNKNNISNYKFVNENRPNTQVSTAPTVPPIPQVPKFIISLNDSDSSSDLEIDSSPSKPSAETASDSVPADMEANIDLLLQEAQRQIIEKLSSDLSKQSDLHPQSESADSEETQEGKRNFKNSALTVVHPPPPDPQSSSHSTPQALKHLPAWQQEEYRRLKKKIAEKEKVLQEVSRAKVSEIEEQSRSRRPGCPQPQPAASDAPEGATPDCQDHPPAALPGSSSPSDTAADLLPPPVPPSKAESPPVLRPLQNYPTDESTNLETKPYHSIVSCSVMEEIGVMNDIVNEFDKDSSELAELRTKWSRLKKLMRLTEVRMSNKEKKLLGLKDEIQKKDRTICSRIDTLAVNPPPKPLLDKTKPSRDVELVKLRYKEVSLRAQFLFHDYLTQSKDHPLPQQQPLPPGAAQGGGGKAAAAKPSAVKRPLTETADSSSSSKKPLLEAPAVVKDKEPSKKSYSGTPADLRDWDPNTPICHFDLNGICKDPECKFQHIQTVS